MARLLKSVCFKVSTHPKFYSYATKANAYEEVLKTLRLYEQDLRNKCKSSLTDSEAPKVLKEHLSQNEATPNVHEDLHFNENINAVNYSQRTIKQTNDICSDNASKEKTFKSEHCYVVKEKFNQEEQRLEHERKYLFPKDEEILIFSAEHASNKFLTIDETKILNQLANSICPKESTRAIKSSKDSKKRTTIKSICDKESSKANKKKSKSKAKSSSLTENKEIKIPSSKHLSNNLISVNETSLNKDAEITNYSKISEERTENKSSDKKTKKSKSSQSKAQFSIDKENLKKKTKLNSAIQSLKSSIEAYINVNKVDQAQRYFEYLRQSKTKKEFVSIELYNLVISGWAQLGRLDKVKHLFLLMSTDKIVPNLASYAGYLEAIARSKCVDVAEIPKVVNEMKTQGYSPKELLQKCVFIGDQREKIWEVLGFVERDLNLPLYVPESSYSFKLLEKLNDKSFEREENHFNFSFQTEEITKISARQMEIESNSSLKIKSVNSVEEITDKIKKSREYLKTCEDQWKPILAKKINELKSPKQGKQGHLIFSGKASVYPYLLLIDTEVLVNLLLQETRMLAETVEFYSPNVKILYRELGLKTMRHYFLSLNKKNNITDKVHFIYKKYLSYLLNPDLCAEYSPREYWEFLKSKYSEGPTIDVSNVYWPYSLIVFMGSVLYDILTKTICFYPNQVLQKSQDKFVTPAFRIKYENRDVKLYKEMRTHDVFAKLYRDAKLEHLEFDVSLVPMLSPPRPWIKYDSGGLLITKIPLIRFPEQAQSQSSYYSKVPPQQLNACFDSLNSLSLCPWIINKPILDIVIKIFQEGGSEELDIPLNPANLAIEHLSKLTDETEKPSMYKIQKEYEKKKGELTSLWFDGLYKLSIANHFRDEIFWFPHNLDFRGRVYPTPPHFNHLGSDLSRSILLFASGKPLGKKGLDWLKIHLINLTGFKKRASHAERLKYANEMLPEILDSADNPFDGKKWWIKSDKPLQTLACCKEVANVVRHPNPEEYISHFPVHQDGSCNGLQHYAALGQDELGAIEVNLRPSNSPQDVYSGVAALVEKERNKDAREGVEIAAALKGFVTRKVVKQTVMTFVYGVTSYGARLQVLKQLKDMPDFPEKYQHEGATYLMKKIFLSIREMFTATKRIQDWFTQCAEEITRVTEDAVEWVTPLGLPVIQPYYKETIVRSSKFCLSKGDDHSHYVSHFEPYQLPNVRKQKNAFAPNFIHSLDSTHMMLTSLFCHRKGITFVSVHDCYWTHAVTVEAMNQICREQFVSLHREPILENLSAFFLERYGSTMHENFTTKQLKDRMKMRNVLSAVPEKGTFDLKKVLDSEYFFS